MSFFKTKFLLQIFSKEFVDKAIELVEQTTNTESRFHSFLPKTIAYDTNRKMVRKGHKQIFYLPNTTKTKLNIRNVCYVLVVIWHYKTAESCSNALY